MRVGFGGSEFRVVWVGIVAGLAVDLERVDGLHFFCREACGEGAARRLWGQNKYFS
jgi:hypothetical protein